MEKVCSKCNIEKDLTEFGKCKASKGGMKTTCKDCVSEYNAMYRKKNADKNKEYQKIYRKRNADKNKTYMGEYYQNNKEKWTYDPVKAKENRRRPEVKEKRREYMKEYLPTYYQNNKEKWTYDPVKTKERRETERSKNTMREYYQREEVKNRYKHRNLMRHTMDRLNTPKSKSTIKELGYSANELFEHLISLGYKDTDHIDHKIPMSWFKDGSPFHIVNHLSNLQPLSETENLTKGNCYADRVDEEYFMLAKEYIIEEYL